MPNMYRLRSLFVLTLALTVYALMEWSCEPKTIYPPFPNKPPVARLANIPADDPAISPDSARFTKSPLVQLFWVGNDPDGFVTAFAYRWSFKDSNSSTLIRYRPWTAILNYVTFTNRVLVLDVDSATAVNNAPALFKYFSNTDLDPDRRNPQSQSYDPAMVAMFTALDLGDTVTVLGIRLHASNPPNVQYPVHESPNSGKFIFESDDFYNRHKFELVAVDNESAVSAIDSIRFWNKKVDPPMFRGGISGPASTDTVFVLDNITLTWPGIPFTYQAQDKNSRIIEYSWHLDSQPWSDWSQVNSAYVTNQFMDTPYTGRHVFHVRARNEFGSITPPDSQPSASFFSVYPPFVQPHYVKRLLLVNEARAYFPPGVPDNPQQPGTARMSKYYSDIMDTLGVAWDVWNTVDKGQPKAIDMANYSTIVIFPDVLPFIGATRPKMIIQSQRYGIYMDAGGCVILTGIPWPILLVNFQFPESLLVKHMSLAGDDAGSGYLVNTNSRPPFDCIGAFGNERLGYPDVTFDSTKLDTSWHGGFPYLSVFRPAGFGEVIFRYNSRIDSTYFENQPMGLRYLGLTYKSVYFGIPLYFVPQDKSIVIMRKALQDVGYLSVGP